MIIVTRPDQITMPVWSRTVFLIYAAGVSSLASAEVCTQIADDEKRLACFDSTRDCAQIESDSDRLECFDNAFAGSPALNVQADTAVISREISREADAPADFPSRPQPSDQHEQQETAGIADASDTFGKKQRKSKESEEYVDATIVEVTTNKLKIDFLWLDNGHIWRETEDSRTRFMVGRKVKIEKGIFNSYNLTMEGSRKTVKVKRVK